MSYPSFRCARGVFAALCLLVETVALRAQPAGPAEPLVYDPDATALILARQYLQGGDGARTALLEALQRMGWGVRDAQGAVVVPAPTGADTGLAFRDYELEELLWNPAEQPAIRLISVARALAVPFEGADPEELAQDLVDTLRRGAASAQPQQRFWARFIVALGRVSPANYDLLAPGPAGALPPPTPTKEMERAAQANPLAAMTAMMPKPVWPADDPVVGETERPKPRDGAKRPSAFERDEKRMELLQRRMAQLTGSLAAADETAREQAQEELQKLSEELTALSQRRQTALMQQQAAALRQMARAFNQQGAAADEESEEEEAEEDDESADANSDPRFVAEWRDEPLSLLQVALIARVLSADLRQSAFRHARKSGRSDDTGAVPRWPRLPLAMLGSLQAGPPTSFGDQFSGAAGDIWATGWGAYTGGVLDHHLPDSKFSKGVGVANTIIAWFKTIMTVARQNITVEVENAPLVRTKTRSPGERRTARCKVVIDFPKSDVLKAIRAAGNLATIDLQMPDGGPVGGAKVVWRLPEGSYNTKYQTAKGGWAYKPELAVVQFAQAGGNAAYISFTNDDGEATITIEGTPQRRTLPPTVRPYPRRAVIAVEVTIKVGNLTQDLNDAINTALGGVVNGTLGFIADMVLRTSFFFQKGRVFEVTDWKEPAWEGEFEITVRGAGSKHEKGQKGGPDQDNEWSMDRYMEGRLHTPEWAEEDEQEREYDNDGRHRLEVDGDSRYFRLSDSSSSRTRNSHNRYEAIGPMQTRPPGPNQLELFSRAEPSGSASLIFNGGMMMLELRPFFGAECIVGRSEQGRGRSSSKAGPEFLSLLGGVYPEDFTITAPNDGTTDYIEGSKTFDRLGSLPYVPSFDVTVTVKYRLWKNGPPPKNKAR